MKLRAKILPKYFKQIKEGKKKYDCRQMESITFVNTETLEEITFEVVEIQIALISTDRFPDKEITYTSFDKELPVYEISLGERINTKEK